MPGFRDDFDAPTLDRSTWFPHYLPMWSSRAATRAFYEIEDSALRLFIPNDAPLWCPGTHPEPLRVSGIASGNWSGPVGSTRGQQRIDDETIVREAQDRFEGWLPHRGRLALSCRMNLSPRSMAALWLAGFEEEPDEAGELCVVEVFGKSVTETHAEVGVGVKQMYDPNLIHDFVDPSLEIDVTDAHTYAVEWDETTAVFSVDGAELHRTTTAPSYPLQIMLGVFDFPNWATDDHENHVPELIVDWVEGDTEVNPPGR